MALTPPRGEYARIVAAAYAIREEDVVDDLMAYKLGLLTSPAAVSLLRLHYGWDASTANYYVASIKTLAAGLLAAL
jgi:hypothetical protein